MSSAESKAKNPKFALAARTRVLDAYLGRSKTKGRFKDPAAIKVDKEPEAQPSEQDLGGDFFG